ncbi:MAG: hypothetical protein ACYDA2_00390 [Acidimicrobiales bacterium]
MFAYVFWHRPLADVETGRYEAALATFLEALGRNSPDGLLGAATCAVDPLPWLAPVGPGYEDWYLLASTAALDPLEQAAVSGSCAVPHAAVAAMAAAGTAGLYRRLGEGAPCVDDAAQAQWLDRNGMAGSELVAMLEARAEGPGSALWMRRLTLGPAPEFCLLGEAADSTGTDEPLPAVAVVVRRRLVAQI